MYILHVLCVCLLCVHVWDCTIYYSHILCKQEREFVRDHNLKNIVLFIFELGYSFFFFLVIKNAVVPVPPLPGSERNSTDPTSLAEVNVPHVFTDPGPKVPVAIRWRRGRGSEMCLDVGKRGHPWPD